MLLILQTFMKCFFHVEMFSFITSCMQPTNMFLFSYQSVGNFVYFKVKL